MNAFGITTITASALTAGFIGLAAPALAAPTGAGNAQDTISSLEDQGYKVIVNRQSNTPLAEANVVSVGEGASFTHTQSINGADGYTGYDRQFAPKTTKTIYVNVR
ncbi:hypothetical protein BH11ACT6_BH11ACT6_38050 [soil metagenome]